MHKITEHRADDGQSVTTLRFSFNMNATMKGALKDKYLTMDGLSEAMEIDAQDIFARIVAARLDSNMESAKLAKDFGEENSISCEVSRGKLKVSVKLSLLFAAVIQKVAFEQSELMTDAENDMEDLVYKNFAEFIDAGMNHRP